MNNQKNILNELFKDTFWVFLMSAVSRSIGNLIDGMIIGKFLGSDAIAAFGLAFPYKKLTLIFPVALAVGMQLMCSRKLGRGELNAANGIFSLAVSFNVGLATFFIVAVYIFPSGVANLLGAEESLGVIRSNTIDYFQAYSLGLPAAALVPLLTPIMQLDGDRARAVRAITILSVANILGDLIAVFYFGGDIWAIGIAATVSYYISAGYLILHFFKPEASFRFSAADIEIKNLREMFLQSLPPTFGLSAAMLRSRFLNAVALSVGGGTAIAAVAIWDNVFTVAKSLPSALANARLTLTGVLISEQDKKSILRLSKFAVKYSVKVSLLVSVVLFLAAPFIAQLYSSAEDSAVFELAVESIRWIAYTLVFVTLTELPLYFYQVSGRFKLSSITIVTSNLLLIVPSALILTPYFGVTGIWMTQFFTHTEFLVLLIVGVWIYRRKITFAQEDILLLPKDFGNNPQLNMTVTFKDDDLSISEVVEVFLEKHNIERKKTMYAAICVEEMVNNILEHGFNDGEKHSIDVRVIIDGDEVIIRIRDDCRPFNPKKWYEIYHSDDPTAHLGIKLVAKMAKDFQYVNVLKLNNLIIKI